MSGQRTTWVVIGIGLGLGLLAAGVMFANRPPRPESFDLGGELARGYTSVWSGETALSTPAKVSGTVLAANGIPQRNAPSFEPRRIRPVGAAPFMAASRQAVLVRYHGDAEGDFAVISLPGSRDDVDADYAEARYHDRVFTTFERPGPGNQALYGVGQLLGSRWVFLVGPQKVEELVPLAAMIPPL